MKVDVYYNLHKKCLSIRSREKENYGRVIDHKPAIYIKNARFVVQPAGFKKTIDTGVKNVHAFVRGEIASIDDIPSDKDWEGVHYNPFKYGDSFVTRHWFPPQFYIDENERFGYKSEYFETNPVSGADFVIISDKVMAAQNVEKV